MFRPLQCYVTECAATVYRSDSTEHTGDFDVCEMEEMLVPEAAAEVESTLGPGVLPSITETEAIMNEVTAKPCSNDTEQHVMKADDLWLCIRQIMQKDVQVAKVVVEHMSKLKSLATALHSKSDTPAPRLPPQKNCLEPANKKAEQQRKFVKVKKVKRRRAEITTSKPTQQEKEFLLNTLSGNVPVISHQPPPEHDYVGNVISQTVHFEHSYTS